METWPVPLIDPLLITPQCSLGYQLAGLCTCGAWAWPRGEKSSNAGVCRKKHSFCVSRCPATKWQKLLSSP